MQEITQIVPIIIFDFDFQCRVLQILNYLDLTLILHQMIKYCLLIALLLLATHSQDEQQIIMVSNSANTAVQSTVRDSQFGSRYDATTARRAELGRQAGDANFAYSKEGEAEWVFPEGSASTRRRIWGIGWVSKYTFCICTDCPQNPATIVVGASSFFVLLHANGTFIGSGWGWSPLSTFTVNLICGCDNRFILYVFNFWASPLGAIFFVKQSTKGCYYCQNLGITHYNRKTCQCECVNGPQYNCPCRQPQTWMGYPSCGCMCPSSLICNWKQYFDMRSCRCVCKEICCPRGFYQHPTLCSCVAGIFLPTDIAFPTVILPLGVDCVPIPCPPPTVWSQQNCRCI